MYKKNYMAPSVPTASIAVNKSRIKLYSKGLDMPTYYLQKGQEFQIELFNPTSDVLLAKIILNGRAISQGGLILNPGQRVFLDRYFDVAKKFLFDTYEVANTAEVKKAIENNGDIKVEFYKERFENNLIISPTWITNTFGGYYGATIPTVPVIRTNSGSPIYSTFNGTIPTYDTNQITTSNGGGSITLQGSLGLTTSNTGVVNGSVSTFTSSVNYNDTNIKSVPTLDMLGDFEPETRKKSITRSKKSIETGRVEQGSHSDQKFETVNKKFEYYPFHTVEYKMLPVSQKVNTTADVNVKRYCTNCGSKLGKTDKFCSNCGTKA